MDQGSVFPTCLPSAHFLLSDAVPDPCLENATTHSGLGLSPSIGHHGISSPDMPKGQLDLDNPSRNFLPKRFEVQLTVETNQDKLQAEDGII